MKKLFLPIIIILFTANAVKAQTPPLNKQQTVDYISDLYKKSYTHPTNSYSIKSVTLDGKILLESFNHGNLYKYDITYMKDIEVKYSNGTYAVYGNGRVILSYLKLEGEATRLKKALEHLITLLKAEKSTDPFDN